MSIKDVATEINALSFIEMMDLAHDLFDMVLDESVWPSFPTNATQFAELLSAWAENAEDGE